MGDVCAGVFADRHIPRSQNIGHDALRGLAFGVILAVRRLLQIEKQVVARQDNGITRYARMLPFPNRAAKNLLLPSSPVCKQINNRAEGERLR